MDLVLQGLRLRLDVDDLGTREALIAELTPPAERQPSAPDPDWTLRISTNGADHNPANPDDTPTLIYPGQGPRLSVLDIDGTSRRVLGRYRSGSSALIETHPHQRRTQLSLTHGDPEAARWAAWLAKNFFASRLLGTGRWRMLHAAAVALADQALLFLAGSGGGKSTLAYRACAELGAEFLSDDLILLSDDATVIGWPTRIALPTNLINLTEAGATGEPALGYTRRRRVFRRAEHRAELGFNHRDSATLAGIVLIGHATPNQFSTSATAVDVTALPPTAIEPTLSKACQIPAQKLYTSDPLGLTGQPDAGDTPLRQRPRAPVAGAVLHLRDIATLPYAPVWRPLATHFTYLPIPSAT